MFSFCIPIIKLLLNLSPKLHNTCPLARTSDPFFFLVMFFPELPDLWLPPGLVAVSGYCHTVTTWELLCLTLGSPNCPLSYDKPPAPRKPVAGARGFSFLTALFLWNMFFSSFLEKVHVGRFLICCTSENVYFASNFICWLDFIIPGWRPFSFQIYKVFFFSVL